MLQRVALKHGTENEQNLGRGHRQEHIGQRNNVCRDVTSGKALVKWGAGSEVVPLKEGKLAVLLDIAMWIPEDVGHEVMGSQEQRGSKGQRRKSRHGEWIQDLESSQGAEVLRSPSLWCHMSWSAIPSMHTPSPSSQHRA